MSVMHKLVRKVFTVCGKSLRFSGGRASNHWEIVDCKRCLAKKEEGK